MRTLIQTPESPQAYEPIDLKLTVNDVQMAMDAYMAFLQLPYDERRKVVHFDEQRPRTGRSGYALKGNGPSSRATADDNKHFFHMTPQLRDTFPLFSLSERELPAESRQLLTVGDEVYRSLAGSALKKYVELERETEFPLLRSVHFPASGKLQHKLRFLAYKQPKDGMLARGHYDKGTGTIAIAESHNGLRVGFGPDDLTLIERGNFDPIFFHGYGWHQLAEMLDVSPDNRRAAWHDVIDTGERVSEDITRWALIYFIDPANIYLESTKEQTHKPIPWRGLGRHALTSDHRSFLSS